MKIYIWGSGCTAGELADNIRDYGLVSAYIDSFPSAKTFLGRPVLRPEELAGLEYDLILVASRQTRSIEICCREKGIDTAKLFYIADNMELRDKNSAYDAAARLLSPEYIERLRTGSRVIREMRRKTRLSLPERELENDYVRAKTLELICERLEKVEGACAELGVYRGGFAACINRLMPDRRLYLFDSFEGFEPGEAKSEREKGFFGEGFIAAHKNTTAQRVLNLMPHPEKVIIRKGLFPGSLAGLEESFALVSLDADLEASMLAGLEYFYPRTVSGGYILLHDYNSEGLAGVRAALEGYERRFDVRLHIVPLCDTNGTAVISK